MEESPGRVHPPDELGVLVVVVHPRRHESHGNRAFTRINSFRYAAKSESPERPSYCCLLRRFVVPAGDGQGGGTARVVLVTLMRCAPLCRNSLDICIYNGGLDLVAMLPRRLIG